MRLIYCYIEEFRNIVQAGFHFSSDYECSYERGRLMIQHRDVPVGEKLLLDDFTKNLTVIVGKTGSGKTNLLQILGMSEEMRVKIADQCKYFLLYSLDGNDNRFVIEINRMIPKGLAVGQKIDSPALLYFTYTDGKITRSRLKTDDNEVDTVIINSFDSDSVRKGYFDGLHIDGVFGNSRINPRFIVPYDKANAGVACRYAKEYISSFSEECIKRNASLEIHSFNWSETMRNELNEQLLKEEYWFYHDYLPDKAWKSVRDVPKFFKRNIRSNGISRKEQFIHDLLTDYALYLRKWAALITPVPSEKLNMYQSLGFVHDLGCPDCHMLPDGKCEDLRKRIDWLCQYIDLHTDEMNGNQGLLWQIGTDIIDIADAFEKFDEDYFSDGTFLCPIEDMDFDNPVLCKLFERMSGYRSDQLGVFTSELLPYNITHLSSGEYQYANVLGIVTEYSSTTKVRSRNKTLPQNIILLLDEPETFMHPEMCRNFLYWMGRIWANKENKCNVQVIMTTHSPFILSDAVSSQVIRIDFDENGFCRVLPKSDISTYAGDIHSILANEFFLDYTIGELSRKRVTAIINILKRLVGNEKSDDVSEDNGDKISLISEIIPYIGDDLIRGGISYLLKRVQDDTP